MKQWELKLIFRAYLPLHSLSCSYWICRTQLQGEVILPRRNKRTDATGRLARVTYEPWPIKASGFDKTGQERCHVKNSGIELAGTVSAEVQANDDLVGCRIIRKMTLARFLDAVNFKDGNPTADPNQHFPDEMWFIEQKTLETHQVVEFELSSVFDLMGVQLPYRQIIKNTCPWKYRGPECGYTGPYFDKNNQQTSMSGADYCTKRYDACNARRNYFADGVIHFGGFIGATRYG